MGWAGDDRLSVCPGGLAVPSEDCLPVPPRLSKYWMTFVFSVLPAPHSLLQVENGSRQMKHKRGMAAEMQNNKRCRLSVTTFHPSARTDRWGVAWG